MSLALVAVGGLLAVAAPDVVSAAPLRWARRLANCEAPSDFYSNRHQPGARPCCPTEVGSCPGGVACPGNGVCPLGGGTCVPGQPATRPNVVLYISDDQAECAWGSAGECRSTATGTPIPAPVTPNLDLLSGYGTLFTVAHNAAAWCYPSLNTILTGRYQRSMAGVGKIGEVFDTLPRVLRSLKGAPNTHVDPFDGSNAVGGYCTFLGGKFAGQVGDSGFDAIATSRKLARTTCTSNPVPGGQPLCGTSAQGTYSPATVSSQTEAFTFLEQMVHPVPGAPGQFAVSPFFLWYAPRIPHAPLSAPAPIGAFLFGVGGFPPLGGVMDLAQYCSGPSCAGTVAAFMESNIGVEKDYYANLWWMDDALRELRTWLARAGAPHCIGADGMGRYGVASPGACQGTWATSVSPDLERNTVFVFLSDNGWFLPNSKHAQTENGYRTRLLVFDPRNLPTVPPPDADGAVIPPARTTDALVHSSDVLPTILGFALDTAGTQSCPVSGGTPCDGRDLRPFLYDANGVASQPPENLRHALCGHETQKPTAPTKTRYILTRAGTVGRCTNLAAPTCTVDADCGAQRACVGNHCIDAAPHSCAANVPCPSGSVCLGNSCVAGPSCINDAACSNILGAGSWQCVEKDVKWCRNAPNARCTVNDDCPTCPPGPGPSRAPCGRVCEPRQLKMYLSPIGSPPTPKLSDLFLDPDENGLQRGKPGSLTNDLSAPGGPYQSTMQTLNCCLDEWWPEVAAQVGTQCTGSCPSELSCVQ